MQTWGVLSCAPCSWSSKAGRSCGGLPPAALVYWLFNLSMAETIENAYRISLTLKVKKQVNSEKTNSNYCNLVNPANSSGWGSSLPSVC